MLSLTSNVATLIAQNGLSRSQTALNSKFQELSASARIKIPTTDRAAEMIAQQERAKALEADSEKTNAALSKLQTEEGKLGTASDTLNRMREVVVQASNGTVTAADREVLNTELSGLKGELQNLSSQTSSDALSKSYDGGNGASYSLVGAAGSRDISVSASTTAEDYAGMLTALDNARDGVTAARASNGAALSTATQNYTDNVASSAKSAGLTVGEIADFDNSAAIEAAKKAKEAMEAAMLNISNMFNNSAHATIMSLLR